MFGASSIPEIRPFQLGDHFVPSKEKTMVGADQNSSCLKVKYSELKLLLFFSSPDVQ